MTLEINEEDLGIIQTSLLLYSRVHESVKESKRAVLLADCITQASVKRETVVIPDKAAGQIATRKIVKEWSWIIIPLSVDFERSDSDWYMKEAMKKAG